MKIIHTSDIHLGSPMTAHLEASRLRERRRELDDVFPRLIREAERVGAKVVIIAGDLFDCDAPGEISVKDVLARIGGARGITFFYTPGNHERDALRKYGGVMPENLIIFGEEWSYFDADNVTVAGRSECTEDMAKSLKLRAERKNIVVLHGELRAKCADGQIGRTELNDSGIDYLALGHYHSYSCEKLGSRGYAVYCGAPEGRGFDELGECGYVLVDTDGDGISHEFIPFARRTVREIEVDLNGIGDPSDILARCEDALRPIPQKDIVRLRLVGNVPKEAYRNTEKLARVLAASRFSLTVKDETTVESNEEDILLDQSIRGEFVRLVMNDPSLDDERKKQIIACGLHALAGERYFDV